MVHNVRLSAASFVTSVISSCSAAGICHWPGNPHYFVQHERYCESKDSFGRESFYLAPLAEFNLVIDRSKPANKDQRLGIDVSCFSYLDSEMGFTQGRFTQKDSEMGLMVEKIHAGLVGQLLSKDGHKLQEGDRIISVDGKFKRECENIKRALKEKPISITITVVRDNPAQIIREINKALGCNLKDYQRMRTGTKGKKEHASWNDIDGLSTHFRIEKSGKRQVHWNLVNSPGDRFLLREFSGESECKQFLIPDYCSRAMVSELSTVYDGKRRYESTIAAGAKVLFKSWPRSCKGGDFKSQGKTKSTLDRVFTTKKIGKACWNMVNDWHHLYCFKYSQCKCPDNSWEKCHGNPKLLQCCDNQFQAFLKSSYYQKSAKKSLSSSLLMTNANVTDVSDSFLDAEGKSLSSSLMMADANVTDALDTVLDAEVSMEIDANVADNSASSLGEQVSMEVGGTVNLHSEVKGLKEQKSKVTEKCADQELAEDKLSKRRIPRYANKKTAPLTQ